MVQWLYKHWPIANFLNISSVFSPVFVFTISNFKLGFIQLGLQDTLK